jgi:hypothetical protein
MLFIRSQILLLILEWRLLRHQRPFRKTRVFRNWNSRQRILQTAYGAALRQIIDKHNFITAYNDYAAEMKWEIIKRFISVGEKLKKKPTDIIMTFIFVLSMYWPIGFLKIQTSCSTHLRLSLTSSFPLLTLSLWRKKRLKEGYTYTWEYRRSFFWKLKLFYWTKSTNNKINIMIENNRRLRSFWREWLMDGTNRKVLSRAFFHK